MEISCHKQGQALIVTVSGRLDGTTAPEFEQTCVPWIEDGEKLLVIDMNHVEYISSAGLRSILSTGKQIKKNKGALVFVGMQGMVREVFDMSGFKELFSCYDSLEEALEQQ
jgi:anti-anti-sigma factor